MEEDEEERKRILILGGSSWVGGYGRGDRRREKKNTDSWG